MNKMKQAGAFLLTAAVFSGILPSAGAADADGSDIVMSAWATEGVQAAYESGAVSAQFDLGSDYTQPISRAQIARLTVDLVAHELQIEVPELAAQYSIELDQPVTDPADSMDASADHTEPSPDSPVEPDEPASAPDDDHSPPPSVNEGNAEDDIPTEDPSFIGDPLDSGLPSVVTGSFADTRSVYIELAARLGIVNGADGLFRPDDLITRAEAAAMMQRCMGVLGFSEANQQPQQFSDSYAIPRWAVPSVKYISGRTDAFGQPIMGGAGGKFSPADSYTIEQSILSIGRMQSSLSVADVAPDWRDAPGYDTVSLALTFGGDCTFGRGFDFSYSGSFDEMYDNQGPAYFFSGIPEFFDDDLTMVNFEGTLTNSTSHANKTFAFKGRPAYAEILQKGSIDVVSVANNHSMDYLQQGFDDTIRNLSPYVQISGYERMPIVTVKGVRIGFASNVGWSFDSDQKRFIENAVQSLRERGAELIVFNYHWGIERSYHSDATQQAIGRYCIDQGADLVIGHHPHVVQEVETYKGKQIAYSLGNLVFGGNHNPAEKNCLIFRYNVTFDLDTRKAADSSYAALPYKVSSVSWRNDYHPIKS